ncbi:hypothetical protein ASG29_10425 [Sphingomonas sp. Leaf412]|uniref:hypothetical protein n=1 Tax=Sphingomonas sp. Leaf412 TaxID=1736370 RepID=UPI0006FDEB3A|nr:hypothetical protein [Sphingomonas sp. Leaf412]KQT32230.1 hypothetical protein ASG29_10425 [Sphingomonas sp. Leaf412]
MRRFRSVLTVVGVALALIGLLWIGQGLGYIAWPRSSFMIDQAIWANYGAAVAALGLLLVLVARRIR